jgi:ABC-type multidrug transport system permease subunit
LRSEHTGQGWVRETMRVGVRQFVGDNPPFVLLTAVLPRPVLQYLFFVLLGGVLAGPAQREFALVGAPVVALTLVAVMISDVPVNDKWSGTFHRIRSGRPHAFTVVLLRALPYPVFGMVALVACVLVVPALTGRAGLGPQLARHLPLYALMAVTTCAAGLAVSMLSLGKRADVLASNALAYLILLAGGVFLPPERLPPVADEVTAVLPVRHGLTAVRAALDGADWLAPALTEAAVGIGWVALGYAVMTVQIRRARRLGHDDYD